MNRIQIIICLFICFLVSSKVSAEGIQSCVEDFKLAANKAFNEHRALTAEEQATAKACMDSNGYSALSQDKIDQIQRVLKDFSATPSQSLVGPETLKVQENTAADQPIASTTVKKSGY